MQNKAIKLLTWFLIALTLAIIIITWLVQKGGDLLELTLKMARAKAGYTKKRMASELGVSRPTYDDYENYNTVMRVDLAQRFCDIVDVSIDNVIFSKQNYT